jgi:hypothetical protein
MTAPIVFHVSRVTRQEPDAVYEADSARGVMSRHCAGQLWSRVAEGRKQAWS